MFYCILYNNLTYVVEMLLVPAIILVILLVTVDSVEYIGKKNKRNRRGKKP